MRKKHAEDEEEHEGNSERWLLTYSDMITLLLALFIIMYGMSAVDSEKVASLSQGLEKALNPSSVTTEHNSSGSGNTTDSKIDGVVQQLDKYIAENKLESQITLSASDAGVSIQLKDSFLFQPNTAELLNEQSPVIKEISTIIKTIYNSIDHISIIGNTADVGNRDHANEVDAYNLSARRAVAVLSLLMDNGVKPNKLVVEGHSHYSPVATNKTQEGRSKNRRVEIMIYKDSINALATKAKEKSANNSTETSK